MTASTASSTPRSPKKHCKDWRSGAFDESDSAQAAGPEPAVQESAGSVQGSHAACPERRRVSESERCSGQASNVCAAGEEGNASSHSVHGENKLRTCGMVCLRGDRVCVWALGGRGHAGGGAVARPHSRVEGGSENREWRDIELTCPRCLHHLKPQSQLLQTNHHLFKQ